MSILTIEKLSLYYGQFKALDDVSMSIEPFRVHGFMGQNGAGKTSLIHAVLGYLKPSHGNIYFDQHQSFETFVKEIGYVPDTPGFPDFLNAQEYLEDVCKVYRIAPEQDLIINTLNLVGLQASKKKIKAFSRGMRQKLAIAAAIIHQPQILIMDEPTSALDPLSRRQILDLMLKLKEKMAILYSTHILEDAEQVCDDVSIIHQGQILFNGSLQSLLKENKKYYLFEAKGLNKLSKLDKQRLNIVDIKNSVATIAFEESAAEVIKKLIEQGIQIESFKPLKTSLEDRFKEIIGYVDEDTV